MSITIEPTVRVESRRQPLPPRERLDRIFHIEELDALSLKPEAKARILRENAARLLKLELA